MNNSHIEKVRNKYNLISEEFSKWGRKGKYYHKKMRDLYRFLIPVQKRILDLGCGNGDLLNSLSPQYGCGVDISDKMIQLAEKKHPHLNFKVDDCHDLKTDDSFDFIIMSDLIGDLWDVQKVFQNVNTICTDRTKIIISNTNFLWDSVLKIAVQLQLVTPKISQNWLSVKDIKNLLLLSDLEVIKEGTYLLFPIYIPLLSDVLNRYIARLPLIRKLCLVQYMIARKKPEDSNQQYKVSVIVAARNEAGNIDKIVERTPMMGKGTELIFVEGGSKDDTYEVINRVIQDYRGDLEIKCYRQDGKGKGDAVRKGFANATGDILMILDADITVPPEDLPKFYEAIRSQKGEFINGSRLVYLMEKEAMRFLNVLGNKFFSTAFSWIFAQDIKDTLCGTKVMFKSDYEALAANRSYFGDFDPFGDFDLLLGSQKLNLKLIEVPIRYSARTYGTTNISRFSHGLLLLRMTIFAARKLKFFK